MVEKKFNILKIAYCATETLRVIYVFRA